MHAPVRRAEGVAGFLHQLFLEGEVREGVVDQLVDHFAHGEALHRFLGDVEVVDHLHDAAVLAIDDVDARVHVVLPDQQCHVRVPCRRMPECRENLGARPWRGIDRDQCRDGMTQGSAARNHAIAPAGFGKVKASVGFAQQVVEGLAREACTEYADADRHADILGADVDLERLDIAAQRLEILHRLALAEIGHERAELLAAETRYQVLRARMARDGLGDGLQCHVAGFVAVGVVDVLEVVDVDDRRRDRLLAAQRVRQQRVAFGQEVAAVRQAGQEVARGQVLQGADQLELVDVLRHPAEELLARERFVQEIVGAALQEARDQAAVAGAGNADDGQVVACMARAQATGEFVPLHAGHFLVDDGQADIGIGIQHRQPGFAVGGFDHAEAVHREQGRRVLACGARIVDDQRGDPPVAFQSLHQPHQVIDAAGCVLQHVVHDLPAQHLFAHGIVVDAADHDRGQLARQEELDDLVVAAIGQHQAGDGHEPIRMPFQRSAGFRERGGVDDRQVELLFDRFADQACMRARVLHHQDALG